MNYPKLKFQINKKLDKQIINHFLNKKSGGFDFAEEIFDIHPNLKNIPNHEVTNYIDEYYQRNYLELEQAVTVFEKKWNHIENDFFEVIDKYFEKLEWPEGNYCDFISIFPIGARFLETKSFQTFYKWQDNYSKHAMHEMIHFQFFNLLDKLPKLELTDKQIWHLSEIFNVVILKESDFQKLYDSKATEFIYPEHKPFIEKYISIWNKNKSIGQFIFNAESQIVIDFQ